MALVRQALLDGVRVFDTANIYGQGDSERLLAGPLARFDDAVVVSKAGKYLTWNRRMLLPIKGLLRTSTRRSATARDRVVTVRAKPMPTHWDAPSLIRSLEGSLRRLNRDRIDVFLLHSPPVEVVCDGGAVSALEGARVAGKVGMIGVSVDDPDAAMACLSDSRVRVVQVPLRPGESGFDEFLNRAAEAGVAVIAREILGGAAWIAGQSNPSSAARSRIIAMVRDQKIALPLVGATRIGTLAASIEAAREAARKESNGDDIG